MPAHLFITVYENFNIADFTLNINVFKQFFKMVQFLPKRICSRICKRSVS